MRRSSRGGCRLWSKIGDGEKLSLCTLMVSRNVSWMAEVIDFGENVNRQRSRFGLEVREVQIHRTTSEDPIATSNSLEESRMIYDAMKSRTHRYDKDMFPKLQGYLETRESSRLSRWLEFRQKKHSLERYRTSNNIVFNLDEEWGYTWRKKRGCCWPLFH